MNLGIHFKEPRARRGQAGFTLTEVIVASCLIALLIGTISIGMANNFAETRTADENVQATQVLVSTSEVFRLYSWSQITAGSFIPPTYQRTFPSPGATNGLTYTVTILITNAPVTESYSNSLKTVIATATWKSGGREHQRQMTTLISQYGMQNYIY